ncbi:MAG: IPTL-CTERM sorting domain-containing protein, partial [Candidatus Competibacter phosphatis]
MDMPRGFVGGMVRLFLGLCLGLLLAGAAWAETATYQILLDTDNNPATGCTVATVDGPFDGAEQRLVATGTTGSNSATVSGVQLQNCTGSGFGAAVWSAGGSWPVGLGNGLNGTAIVETYLPLSAWIGSGPARLGVVSEAGGGQDALLLNGGQTIQLTVDPSPDPASIPVLNPLALALLALLLAGGAAYGLRRQPGTALLMVLVLTVAGAGLAWAAFVRDGQATDWANATPVATDPQGDAAGAADLAALFGQMDGAFLNFRIDAAIALGTSPTNQAPRVNAGTAQTITLPAGANLTGTVTDDGLPNPPGAVTMAWTTVNGPGTVTFGTPNARSTAATFSAAGAYVLRLTASDGQLSASATVTVTVNPTGGGSLPPDPATVAPAVNAAVATTTFAATEFLYTGSNPIQTGVAPGTIEAKRAAVLRGRVLDKNNAPLSGVTLTVLNHPEFGQTLSRADGWFDLVVNGGS